MLGVITNWTNFIVPFTSPSSKTMKVVIFVHVVLYTSSEFFDFKPNSFLMNGSSKSS